MVLKKIIGVPDRFLKYCLIGCLSFSTLIFLFVFILNWEDRVLGFKLDGQPAGLYLFAKWLIPAVLAGALVRYPRYSLHVAAAAACYYGWLLLDSSVTTMMLTHNTGSFPLLPTILFLVAVSYLGVHAIAQRHPFSD